MKAPKKEDKEAFIQRCMSNPRMETEYPTRDSTTGSMCSLMGKKMNYLLALVDGFALCLIIFFLIKFKK
jgi:hypothetical protein